MTTFSCLCFHTAGEWTCIALRAGPGKDQVMGQCLKPSTSTTEFWSFLLTTYRSHLCFGRYLTRVYSLISAGGDGGSDLNLKSIEIIIFYIFCDISWRTLQNLNWTNWTTAKTAIEIQKDPETTNFTKQLMDAPRAPHDGSGSHWAPTGRAARRWIWFEGLIMFDWIQKGTKEKLMSIGNHPNINDDYDI